MVARSMELQSSSAPAAKSKAVFLGGVEPGVMREIIEAVAFARTGHKPKAMYPKAGHGLKVIFETRCFLCTWSILCYDMNQGGPLDSPC